jgi:hypothetical protein
MSLSKLRQRIGKGPDRIDLTAKQAGQILVVFALMLTVLIGLVGIAIDVTYAWRNGIQIQRAADAAAMAGVVYLPGDIQTGSTKAKNIAAANGYSTASGATVTPTQSVIGGVLDPRKMDVTITADVPTFFVNLFGVNHWTISRSARAAYVLPVPMGSPLSYLGVGCFVLSNGSSPYTTKQTSPAPPTCSTTGTGQSGITRLGTTADGGTSLGSLGAFGAVITRGGNQENGDAYLPANNTSWTVNTAGKNTLYDPKGYFYTVTLPAAGSSIQLFDPGFCAMGGNGSNSSWGTGDHWIGTPGTGHEVSTFYYVLDTNGTPMIPSNWQYLHSFDKSYLANNGFDAANGANPGNATSGCDATWHNKWVTLASGLGPGTYEVEVSTTDPNSAAVNANTNAENMFAIQAVGGNDAFGNGPTVFGYDKMCVYNNLMANNVLQQFYLAKVDAVTGAGKTLTIDLFDVGDSTAGTIQILSPAGPNGTQVLVSSFQYTTFNYDASSPPKRVGPPGNCNSSKSDACQDPAASKIVVAASGGSSFNNTWIEITVPLVALNAGGTASGGVYGSGSGGLWQGGWWQVQYNVSAGNDTTTWSVNVNGNPVHLLPM